MIAARPAAARGRPGMAGGMALVLALWLVVLLSVMATGHARTAHQETRLTARQLATGEARALAEAGVARAILDLLSPREARHWSNDGVPRNFELNGRSVIVSIRDAAGLVDLNRADADLIDALIGTADVALAEREAIVDAVLDWRDTDDLRRMNGAEDADYSAAGLPWTARDGAFVSVDELRYVMGVSPALYDAVAPLATVHSGRSGIALEFAPPQMLVALTGRDVAADELRAMRDSADGGKEGRMLSSNAVYHIRAAAGEAESGLVRLEVVVEIDRGDSLFAVREWRESIDGRTNPQDRNPT